MEHPNDYRWTLGRSHAHGPTYIDVIEPAEKKPRRANTPFGFARELATPVDEPLLFEGEGA